jgi:hypothetical protein
MQQEIQRAQVGELEAFDLALDQFAEVTFDAIGGNFA